MMLHKLRRATVVANRTRLSGVIEIDEAWIGGEQKGMPGGRSRQGRRAALAVLAVETHDGRPVRLRIKLIPDDKAVTLIGFVKEVVEPGSVVVTDGWKSYLGLTAEGYVHQRVVEGSGASFINPVPAVHIAIGNLKAWLIGTHKGVWPRHLAAYLDEFVSATTAGATCRWRSARCSASGHPEGRPATRRLTAPTTCPRSSTRPRTRSPDVERSGDQSPLNRVMIRRMTRSL